MERKDSQNILEFSDTKYMLLERNCMKNKIHNQILKLSFVFAIVRNYNQGQNKKTEINLSVYIV